MENMQLQSLSLETFGVITGRQPSACIPISESGSDTAKRAQGNNALLTTYKIVHMDQMTLTNVHIMCFQDTHNPGSISSEIAGQDLPSQQSNQTRRLPAIQ